MLRRKKTPYYYVGQEIPTSSNDRYRFLDKTTVSALKTGRFRMLLVAYLFLIAFAVLSVRLFEQTILKKNTVRPQHSLLVAGDLPVNRADIVDRNGTILATSLPTVDLYVDARDISNPEQMAQDILKILPTLDKEELLEKLKSQSSFKYLKRNLTPKEQYAINRLGYPQLNFTDGEQRIYPQSHLFSHIIGLTNIDNKGIAGLEMAFHQRLTTDKQPLQLSVDTGVQNIIRYELAKAMDTFSASAGAALVMNAQNGEIIALTSLPDFDPNRPATRTDYNIFNRATLGLYEVGSVMKPFTVAMGLETGLITPDDRVDATKPLRLGRFTVTDFQGKNRFLTIPEVLIYSSNIGSAKIGMAVGVEKQKAFLERFGLLSVVPCELPERGRPIQPDTWREVNGATISYGYGIAVSPLHMATAVSALVNGGLYRPPTFLKNGNKDMPATQIISPKTSQILRHMMRAVIDIGSGKRANIKGYLVGGKTGSAEMQDLHGRYIKGTLRTSFVGAFPMDNPQYVLYVMLENPKKRKEDWYFNTAGWNAAPTGGAMIEAIAPHLGVTPKEELEKPSYIEVAYEQYKPKK